MITAFHHVALLLSSEESLAFYRKLGFQETFRKKRKNDTVVLLDGYGIQLEVFIDPNHPEHVTGKEEPLGLRHFALKVDSIEETVKELGVEAGEIMLDWTGVRYCFIDAPDGLVVELHE